MSPDRPTSKAQIDVTQRGLSSRYPSRLPVSQSSVPAGAQVDDLGREPPSPQLIGASMAGQRERLNANGRAFLEMNPSDGEALLAAFAAFRFKDNFLVRC
jgi:hypothetical protein